MSWPKVRLGDVCDEVRDRIAVADVDLESYVTTDNMLKGCLGIRVAEGLPPSGTLVRYLQSDVLTSNIRPYLKKTWLADRSGGCSSDVIVYRSKDKKLSARYLYSVLSSDSFFDYSMRNVSGAKMPRGKRDWLGLFEFPLPPLAEQKRIVAKLEKELERVEAMKAKFERMELAAKNLFKAALAEEFEKVEGERVKLGDVCEFKRGLTYSKSDEVQKSDNIVLRSNNVSLESSALDFTELKYVADTIKISPEKKVIPGSVLICMANGSKSHLGKVALIDKDYGYAFGGFMGLLIPRSKIVSKYLFGVLTSYKFKNVIRKLMDGANINNLKFSDIEGFSFTLPPIKNQREIVARLDAIKARSEGIAAIARKAIGVCEQMRKAILAEAFQ